MEIRCLYFSIDGQYFAERGKRGRQNSIDSIIYLELGQLVSTFALHQHWVWPLVSF